MPPATMISRKRDVSCETEAEMMGAKVSKPKVHFLQEDPKLKPVFQDSL